MKIFTSAQIKELDKFTIENEPISSLNLMERAAQTMTRSITELWGTATPIVVFAGPGNNGGDALAIARMMADQGYQIVAYLFNISGHLSPDCAANKKLLEENKHIQQFFEVTQEFDPPVLDEKTLVIDGLFGSGLNKPLAGGFASLVKYINASPSKIVSIDAPSGLMAEDNTYNIKANIIRAYLTLTLQQPKLSFFFAENQQFIGQLRVLDIRLSQEGIQKIDSSYTVIEENDIRNSLLPRNPYAHKGQMGHALLIAGSYCMAGAAILAAKACLRSGVGKLTVHTQEANRSILQVALPEAILDVEVESRDKWSGVITKNLMNVNFYSAVGMGPGVGTDENAFSILSYLLTNSEVPLVLDADALNIIAAHPGLMEQVPPGSILTPHKGELSRLLGPTENSYEQMQMALQVAQQRGIYIIAKDAYTEIITPDGSVFFNTTGNAGMATAGSGDVLTGIILSLLAQGYSSADASLLGVYLHGLAGDFAAKKLCEESIIASDIIEALPEAFKFLRK